MGFHFSVSGDHQYPSSWFLEGVPCAIDPLMDLCRRKWTVPPIPITLWDPHHDPRRSILLTEILLLFSHKAMSDSLWLGLQHTRRFCPYASPRVCLKSYPLNGWSYTAFSFVLTHVSSWCHCLQESGSFEVSQFFDQVVKALGTHIQHQWL